MNAGFQGPINSTIRVFPKIGARTPKMDGENNGSKPYEQMDGIWGAQKKKPIFGSTPMYISSAISKKSRFLNTFIYHDR